VESPANGAGKLPITAALTCFPGLWGVIGEKSFQMERSRGVSIYGLPKQKNQTGTDGILGYSAAIRQLGTVKLFSAFFGFEKP
jgi:hypothetical protein